MKMDIGIVLLAAGGSSRMGRPKQTLPYGNTSLLKNAIQVIKHFDSYPQLVVLGAYADEIKNHIIFDAITSIENKNWQQGISSSIHLGLNYLEKQYAIQNILFMVADQPYVNKHIINSLLINQLGENGKEIGSCQYAKGYGTPCIFSQKYFKELYQLKGNSGAKRLIEKYKSEVNFVPFEKGAIDIDTPQDYKTIC